MAQPDIVGSISNAADLTDSLATVVSSVGSGSSGGSGSASLFAGSGEIAIPLPIPSPRGLAALAAAATQTGKPYLWGGNGPDAWDCSGLVQWAFRTVGISLPRTSQEMARYTGGMLVPLSALQPGDVITMDTYDIAGHVGIYAGNGMVFNAYGTGVPTGLRPLSDFRIHNIRRFF
ncbi:NlpC/P60 family protein [Rhodococcus hoagii]|uniref:NlpC/P60 family protein n=3 Tax=Rhodococcus hoagii TaxID=43767 RepID=A0AAE4ZBP2_RHOHA|nr:NlpC/P60 family protein [Prescottella equi]MBM4535973.1 NlpC/P60 family protein [Prescottella equi]MBM4649734.1 NlpC/P60 family protein [Prescottella equi]MBM4682712.1 NlpC/P60 family protein [Prescottella equi]MBM4729007.1 NlpC/P60 family protein [Prescottella equi]